MAGQARCHGEVPGVEEDWNSVPNSGIFSETQCLLIVPVCIHRDATYANGGSPSSMRMTCRVAAVATRFRYRCWYSELMTRMI